MDIQKLKKGCAAAVILYIALAILFYFVGGEQLHWMNKDTDPVSPVNHVGELTAGIQVWQPFVAEGEQLTGADIRFSTFARENSAAVRLSVAEEDGTQLAAVTVPSSELKDNDTFAFEFDTPVDLVRGVRYYLLLESPDGRPGSAVTVWYGNTFSVARAEIDVSIPDEEKMFLRSEPAAAAADAAGSETAETAAAAGRTDAVQDGRLCCALHMRRHLLFGDYYWYGAAALGLALLLFCLHLLSAAQKAAAESSPEYPGEAAAGTGVLGLLNNFSRYSFLMRQLIGRDFKTKYKRSVLGIFWSFLNPLLTMVVQYLVFSTIFKSDIDNFPLYLLTGIVCFSFFSESTNMALLSIVGNAQLITKVYVPKYIYPITRVISSSINLLLAFIPLFAVMLLTRTPLRPAIVLLPYGLLCLVIFSTGLSLLLSACMVFFRDTQFLWGVISMIWMYLTPVFYPETIIPPAFMAFYKCNPLYHMIRFIRIILIDGVSPEPMAYLYCLLGAVLPLLLGALVFRKCQDRFIFNL